MRVALRVLMLEDRPEDAERMAGALRASAYDPDWRRVESEPEFLAALEPPPDVILADLSLPDVDGLRAFDLVRQSGLDTPFIIVTGSFEERALEAVRRGADDYLLKDRLERLGPAVEAARERQELRRATAAREQALLEAERRYRSLFEGTHAVMLLVDPADGRIADANPAACAFYGYARQQLLEIRLNDLRAPGTPPAGAEVADLAQRRRVELEHRTADGALRRVELYGGPLEVQGRSLLHVIVHDITDRKRAEQELLESEGRFRSLVDQLVDAVFLHDGEGRLIDVNRQACLSLGYSREELLGGHVQKIETDYGAEQFHSIWARVAAGESLTLVGTHRRKDGSTFPVEVRLGPFAYRGARYVLALARDISERQAAEQALREERDFVNALVQTSPAFYVAIGANGRLLMMNQAMLTALGYTREEVEGRRYLETFVPPQERAALQQAFDRLVHERQPVTTINNVRRKDGRDLLVEWRGRPVVRADGSLEFFIGMGIDITEPRRQAERRDAAYRIAQAANTSTSLEAFLRAVHQEVGRAMDATNLYVALCDREQTRLDFPYYIDEQARSGPAEASFSRPFSRGVTEYAIRRGGALRLTGEAMQALADRGEIEIYGGRPRVWMGIPLRRGEVTVGLLAVQNYNDPQAYDDEDAAFLEFVSDQIAVAVERWQAQQALEASEARFRRLAENAQDLIFRYRLWPEPGFEYVSPAATVITGYTPEAHYDDPELGLKLIHPEDRAALARQLAGGEPERQLVLRWVRSDGRVIWTDQRNVPIYDGTGRLVALEGIARDITREKLAEQTLAESQRALMTLMDNLPGMAYRGRHDERRRMDFVSQGSEALTGYPQSALEGQGPAAYGALIDPQALPDVLQIIQEGVESGRPFECSYRIVNAHGEERWVWERGRGVYGAAGELLSLEGFITDVTERAGRERERQAYLTVAGALRGAAARPEMVRIVLEQIMGLLGAGGASFTVLDPADGDSVVELGLGAWTAMTGERIPAAASLSQRVMESGDPFVSDHADREPRIAAARRMGGLTAVAVVPVATREQPVGALWVGRMTRFSDGDVRLLTVIAEMVGNALHRAGVLETLEERVAERTLELAQANERLLELDRLKSDFVSNVSHELRTPITNILLYTDLLGMPGREEKRAAYLDTLRGEAQRLGALIEDLLTLSRMERGALPMEFEPHALDPLIAEVITAHAPRAAAKRMRVEHEPNPTLPVAPISRPQMAQVLTNLVANALAYSPPGSVVRLTAERRRAGRRAGVAIRVHNTGEPIPAHDLPRVFERFFRGANARASGESGTGLGLSICKEIVERHGGAIEAESSPSAGTTFTVWLPAAGDRRRPRLRPGSS